MEDNLNFFEKIRLPQFLKGRRPQFFFKGRRPQFFLKMENDLKEIIQPHTIKSKNNDCGTAPGNLVSDNIRAYKWLYFSVLIARDIWYHETLF
jgi:hypothetical protein